MSGNKATRRAMETVDSARLHVKIPLIVDTTVLITPAVAMEMLKHNQRNRPINWRKVEEYAEIMRQGKWELHAQGIILDTEGNILTGQKRLWAVIKANVAVYFRVSRGNPASTANLLDRGDSQSARDLATRESDRKHSPTESSIARAIAVLNGIPKPSTDDLAHIMADNALVLAAMLKEMPRMKKSRAMLMICAVIADKNTNPMDAAIQVLEIDKLADRLTEALAPTTPESCWNKGAAFTLAMQRAHEIVG